MSISERLKKRLNDESGDSEVITALLVLPIIIWLLFSSIDVSLYMNARSQVVNAARDGARQVAVYGGDNNTRLNTTGRTVTQTVFNRLYQNGKCTVSACTKPPVVTCTPATTARMGDVVQCSITYYYTAAAKGNPIAGFASFLNKPFTVVETARAEVGFSR